MKEVTCHELRLSIIVLVVNTEHAQREELGVGERGIYVVGVGREKIEVRVYASVFVVYGDGESRVVTKMSRQVTDVSESVRENFSEG